MNISKEQKKAACEIVNLIADVIGQNREVHPATAIAASSRLAGTFLFKSFELDLQDVKPGAAVLSYQANGQCIELMNLISAVLAKYDLTIDKVKMETAELEKAELDFLESHRVTHKGACTIMLNCNLSNKEMAIACSISTAFIMEKCKKDIAIEPAFITAVHGLIEGSKTVPLQKTELATEQKKWYNLW